MKLRTVKPGGRVHFRGRVFAHDDLAARVGEQVLVLRDESNGEADCIVIDPDTLEHVCNAHNARRWAEITRRIDAEIADMDSLNAKPSLPSSFAPLRLGVMPSEAGR